MKNCSKCEETKELVEFYKCNANKNGLQGECKTCNNARTTKWKKANPEKVRANLIKWRAANPEKNRDSQTKWIAANPDKHRAKQTKYRDKLVIEHPGRGNFLTRLSKLKYCTPTWLTANDLQDMEVFYRVTALMSEASGINFEVDHIIPLKGETVSGLHCPSNLQVITKQENIKKSNTIEQE